LAPSSGALSGIDPDFDLLIELSEHPNCFGVKVSPPSGVSDAARGESTYKTELTLVKTSANA
jgi:hypothetical protein